jgi:putative aminopeptidase FrvX
MADSSSASSPASSPTPEFLRALLTAPGPSGYETAPAKVWREEAEKFAADVRTDVVGSTSARVPGTADGARLLIVGHIDEIGLIVSHIDDKGFLFFLGVGGWDPIILVGQRVEIITRDGSVPGVVGKKPIHLLTPEERKKVPELKDLHIDIGAADEEEARSMVRVGDVAVIAGEPVEVPNGRLVSRSMDNRLGAYIALEAARKVHEAGGAPGDVVAAAVTQEEITFAGATTTTFAQKPAVAIVVDVTHATDAPGIEIKEIGKHEFGSGAVVDRGSTLHPLVFERLVEAAEAESIPFTVEAHARYTGTDADAVHLSRAGVPTGNVSIPLRYMHSPVEMVSLGDVQACIDLVAAFALRLEAGTSFTR